MTKILLVDANDRVVGKAEKAAAHQGLGQRHRAFSVLIVDNRGRMLIQQRSRLKPLWSLFWTNACCSHQARAGNDTRQAKQRLREELGFSVPLRFLFKLPYRRNYKHDRSEYEITYVFWGRYQGEVTPDSKEVADYRWVSLAQLQEEIADQPDRFTPWFQKIIHKIHQDGKLRTQVWGQHGQ